MSGVEPSKSAAAAHCGAMQMHKDRMRVLNFLIVCLLIKSDVLNSVIDANLANAPVPDDS
jgi:hypothetical protein